MLNVCDIPAADAQNVVNIEGINTPAKIARFMQTDGDIENMAKRMASRTNAAGRTFLSTGSVKNLQALAWWARDRVKRGLIVDHNKWDAAALEDAFEHKVVESETKDSDVMVKDLGQFKLRGL